MLEFGSKFGVVLVFDASDDRRAIDIPEVKEVLGRLGQINLGASVQDGFGYWHPTGEYERAVSIYTAYNGDEDTRIKLIENVLPTVRTWAESTEQEAVAFIENDGLVIIDTLEFELNPVPLLDAFALPLV